MATAVGPDIVEDGVVLSLDAGSRKSFNSFEEAVEVLAIAGGGGGGVGSNGGGGGGAGGFVYNSSYSLSGLSSVSVTVGAGGSGSTGRGSGSNGANSVFGTITAYGGGRGGGHSNGGGNTQPNTGGSGGGGSYSTVGASPSVQNQGTAGGSGAVYLNLPVARDSGGGGGGAGGAGANGQGSTGGGGAGGAGKSFDISGVPTFYAGGGAGATNDMNTRAIGGSGGGGNGATPAEKNGDNGSANTGSGGGGGNGGGGNSGAGGSGVVIIRYIGKPRATGGTITSAGIYTVHTFTSSGTFSNANLVYNIIDNSTYTLQNSLGKVSDKSGTWDYDGGDDYISGPTNSFGTLTSYTIAFWARRDSENKMYIGTSNNTFYWYGDNSWRYVHGGTGGEYYYPKNVSIPSGTWGYYVATYDGANVKIYRQGIYQGAKASTGTVTFDSLTFTFGKFSSGSTYAFNGLGGNIYLYNKALTQAEITQNYNAQKNRFL